jgi:hypothetical protein
MVAAGLAMKLSCSAPDGTQELAAAAVQVARAPEP